MEIQKEELPSYAIQSYEPHQLTIAGKVYTQSLLVCAQELICPWGGPAGQDLDVNDFLQLDLSKIELIIVGQTQDYLQIPVNIRRYLFEQRIGIETMNLGAACRTFNILLSEDRQILGIFRLNQ